MRKIYLVLLFCLTSCASNIAHTSTKLSVGLTRDEMVAIMGKPAEKRAIKNTEIYVYFLHDSLFDFFFNKKKPPYVGFYPLLRTGREFWVVLENSTVVMFGYADEFKNYIPSIPTSGDKKDDAKLIVY